MTQRPRVFLSTMMLFAYGYWPLSSLTLVERRLMPLSIRCTPWTEPATALMILR